MAKERPQRPVRQRPTRSFHRPAPSSGGGGDDEEEYVGLIQEVHDMINRERLHVPDAIEAEVPVLPFDLTSLSDKQLQSLYSAFTAFSYRTGYLLMLEESKASKCGQAADEIVTAYLAQHSGDEGSVTAIKAQAEQIDEVSAWRKRQRAHAILADSQRKQRDNYDKVCERLSRLETMRQQEFERAGQRLSSRPRPSRK